MTPASDIDLRIDKGRIRGVEMGGLLLDLEDALGVPVDLIPTSSLSGRFLSSIQKDEVMPNQLGIDHFDLEDALGVPVDLIPTGGLSERFLSSIQKDEVLLYEA